MPYKTLKIDCENCFGLCCVALYFSTSEGFPKDKVAGDPCPHLQPDFKCDTHATLREKGLKGCTAYDCFGAGQKVSQDTYKGISWLDSPSHATELFDSFIIMRQLHEMLWYVTNAKQATSDLALQNTLTQLIEETVTFTNLDPAQLKKLDLLAHKARINSLLSQVSESVRNAENSIKAIQEGRGDKQVETTQPLQRKLFKHTKKIGDRLDCIGADLRKWDMRGADLRGALLIAANLEKVDLSGADLIGADLRDATICGANLSNALFITQGQINSAKGDDSTQLPSHITRPYYWSNL